MHILEPACWTFCYHVITSPFLNISDAVYAKKHNIQFQSILKPHIDALLICILYNYKLIVFLMFYLQGYPVNQIRPWPLQQRSNGTTRPSALELEGAKDKTVSPGIFLS